MDSGDGRLTGGSAGEAVATNSQTPFFRHKDGQRDGFLKVTRVLDTRIQEVSVPSKCGGSPPRVPA